MPSQYNCLQPQPPLSADADITGRGVIANYVATAAIAVLLIIIYFFVVYEPALDPFRKTDQDPLDESFRPKPIDRMILRTVRHIPKRLMGARKVNINARVENGFIECILAMSDLQVVTGISILISGYAQLPQGLSSFHWMVIVDLAWFSCLTHLACLTLLRNHLYNHSLQRIWRLLCMAILIILLTVALSFTGGYDWTAFEEWGWKSQVALNMIDPAMCHLSPNSRSSMAYYGMIFSILLIVFGFVVRIIKLHKTISVEVWEKATAKLSMQVSHLSSTTFAWCCLNSSPKSLKRTLIYRPLLTTLLVARLFLDGWSSMFFEVWWLIFSFIWGTIRLFGVLAAIQATVYLDHPTHGTSRPYKVAQDSDERDSDWEFGQVVALVLLLAPLITIIKYFNHGTPYTFNAPKVTDGILLDGKQAPDSPEVVTGCSDDTTCILSSHSASQSICLTIPPFTHETSSQPDNSNSSKWDDHTQTLGAAIIYFMLMCAFILITLSMTRGTGNPLKYWKELYLPVVIALIGLWGVVLFSLTIELDLSYMPLWAQRLIHLVNILFFLSSATSSPFRGDPLGYFLFLISAVVFYILYAVFYRILESISSRTSG
ncbi:hypothetical protein N7517_010738 [Penicillium concentricum]|uniref:Uncharacterized protein n=1 Tax=Penicillium concentricum TaxID=293559 RepID=A0A9W9RBC0_9EURO|nr:uncharacterized protein N7517_010738 [Penicillium concentricum]KAJ5356129.1 hypothetical protein N7517_010738 [Penicillium concentricum]